jgi:cobalt-zinc-cadmium efflux system protein
VALVLNGIFLVVEVVVGLMADSLALLADAGHMLSDVAALGLALVARRVARAAASRQYTFGWRRVPVLGGLINGATLIVVVVLVVREATARLLDPVAVSETPVLVAGVIGLFVNLVSAWYLHRAQDHSVNIRGAMLHLLADALGSVAAIASALVILWTGWHPIDPILSFVIAALILFGSWPLLRDTVNIVLQRAPSSLDVGRVEEALEAREDIARIVDLHVWELAGDVCVASMVLVTERDEPVSEANRRMEEIKAMLAEEFEIRHATIEWRHASVRGSPLAHE